MIKAVIFDMFETLVTHYNVPLYFGKEIAKDAGVEEEKFLKTWNDYEEARTTGEITLEEIVTDILKRNDKYTPECLSYIVKKRKESKKKCFYYIWEEIINLLEELKKIILK